MHFITHPLADFMIFGFVITSILYTYIIMKNHSKFLVPMDIELFDW